MASLRRLSPNDLRWENGIPGQMADPGPEKVLSIVGVPVLVFKIIIKMLFFFKESKNVTLLLFRLQD